MYLAFISKSFKMKGFIIGLLSSLVISPSVFAVINIAQSPLFLTTSAKPIVMLNISNDHQLYFKAFDDYTDLNEDGIPETSYLHEFSYYGYFDSGKCYDYSTVNDRFEPSSLADADNYCSNSWSGNFLNWASMSRIDTIRKMLYGGLRSTDSSTATVLERAYIPTDAHSFAKFYDGNDLTDLTPYSSGDVANGITLCSTTVSSSSSALSQNVTDDPLIRVAAGDFSLWAAHERFQCQWREDRSTNNGNVPADSGIPASDLYPERNNDRLGGVDYVARVQVCASDALKESNCELYDNGTSLKPTGILQDYGGNDQIRFGLMTGTYRKHISGGVLRKNASSFTDEINATDGTFSNPLPTDSIINTLDSLRLYGYRYSDGNYFQNSTAGATPAPNGSDRCNFRIANLEDNEQCTNWGNPQSEIYLESLRYLAGLSATTDFSPASGDDSSFISGLTTATVSDPISSTQHCAALNIIQFNASVSSYDSDDLAGAVDLGITDLNSRTDIIGTEENLNTGSYFIGENGTDNDQFCTAKSIPNLSLVRGTCPDAPRLQGSFHIAGLAHYAHVNDIRSDRQDDQLVTTYGVALTPSLPKADIPIPNSTDIVTILPACQNTREFSRAGVRTSCSIVDFKIVDQDHASNPATGSLYVNWETGEAGGDYDQDMWGILNYSVTATEVTVTTEVFNESTGAPMAFGYIISGTTQDGFHAHSGIEGYSYTDPTGVTSCSGCQVGNAATSVTYTIGSSNIGNIEQPLFYAAKYGGFIDTNDNNLPDQTTEWDNDADGQPDRYFFAIDPNEIAASLETALNTVLAESGSSASVATSSTRLDTNTVIYQAKFNTSDWTGQFLAFSIDIDDGSINAVSSWDAGEEVTSQGLNGRNIFTYNTDTRNPSVPHGVSFDHSNLSDDPSQDQQATISSEVIEYLKGSDSNEEANGGSLRDRSGPNKLLGDIINSDPVFIGEINFGYHLIPPSGIDSTEPDSYLDFRNSSAYQARPAMVAIGANDGMLHIINGSINQTDSGKEVFAYMPDALLDDISTYTSPTYTTTGQHRYFMDGSPVAGDAYIDADNDGNKEWRTVLIGTTGVGEKAVFALDVSFIDPTDNTVVESDFLASRVLWEINTTTAPNATDLTDSIAGLTTDRFGFSNHLGLTTSQPSIVRMANGKFAAVMGNGYDSANQTPVLYIIDIGTGEIIKSISTKASSDANGLSTPISIDVNGDRVIDAVYAGDLNGNLWKFDVSSSDPADWQVAYGTIASPQPLYIAKDSSGNNQPITAKPQVGSHPDGGVMVYFGTGKYFEIGDNSTTDIQTFYGIRDDCVSEAGNTTICSTTSTFAPYAIANQRDVLQEQTIDAESLVQTTDVNGDIVASFNVRQTSEHTVDFSTQHGWYMDLLTPPQPGTAEGERVVTFPLLRSGRIIFVTLIPSNLECDFGGTSWLMELNALNGKREDQTPFDITGDGKIDDEDLIAIFDEDGDGEVNPDEITAASGKQSNEGIIKTPGVIVSSDGELEYKYTSGSSGNLESTTESRSGGSGRQSWIQLQ